MSRYLIFVTAACALLLSSIDITIVAVAFPVITSFFHTSLIMSGWIISIYQLVTTASLPLAGKISDVISRKFTFILCVSLFTFGSLLCSVAPSIELLIVFRFIQALGASGIVPSATGIVADVFPESRQRAIGLFSSIYPIGSLIGPNLGGWMAHYLGWRSLFWINIPIGLITLIASFLLLSPGPRKRSEIDFMGAALVGISISTLMGGLSLIGDAQSEQTWVIVGTLFCVTILSMILLIRHELRAIDPIIDIEIMRGKPFVAANIYNLLYGAPIFGIMSLIPAYSVYVYGMSTIESGFILTPRSVGVILASLLASNFLVRWGYRRPMILGTTIVAIGFLLLSLEPNGVTIFGRDVSNFTLLAIILFLLGAGAGVVAPAANNACIELMPERIATITGIRNMFRQCGGAISVTIATVLLHKISNISQGFFIVFFCVAIIFLVSISAIFAMPASPACNTHPKEATPRL